MPETRIESILPKDRLETLCDAIFAVTMTLMVLELKAPENIPPNLASAELPGALWDLFPAAESYVISFIILGTFWLRHQIQFKYLKSVDMFILVINIFFLLMTGFVPFSVELMKKYPDYNLPFILYSITLLIISILLYIQWYYISSNDTLIKEDVLPEIKKRLLFLSWVPVIIFSISIGLSFINTTAAFRVVYLVPIFYLIYNKYFNKTVLLNDDSKK